MKKALAVILTIICGLLTNIIAAVLPVWALLTSENIVFGVLVGLPIACGLAALLNLIGKKIEGKCGLARRAFLLIAQAPFVVLMAALFIQNAVELHNYNPSLDDMWSGMYGWGLELSYYAYLGALATAVMTTVAAFALPVAGVIKSKKQE